MSKTEFTMRSLEKIAPQEKRFNVLDRQTRGLGLVVHPSGEKTYFHQVKVLGYPRRTTIGPFDSITVEQSRGKAAELNSDVARWKLADCQGPAPFEKNTGEPTFGETVEYYIENHLKKHGKNATRAERNLRYTVKKHLSSWKDRKISTIRQVDVERVHTEVGKTKKYAANQIAEIVTRRYNFAKSEDNPASGIKRFHEEPRDRFLGADELARLWEALKKSPVDLQDFVNLSLFTGARKGDVLSMRWTDVDGQNWRAPTPRSRRPYVISLTPEKVLLPPTLHFVHSSQGGLRTLGKSFACCRVAVSLSLATEQASLPIAWRLCLPEIWAKDRKRRETAAFRKESTLQPSR